MAANNAMAAVLASRSTKNIAPTNTIDSESQALVNNASYLAEQIKELETFITNLTKDFINISTIIQESKKDEIAVINSEIVTSNKKITSPTNETTLPSEDITTTLDHHPTTKQPTTQQ